MQEIERLIRSLGHAALHWEVFALVACLALAYGISLLLGRRREPGSVWFGHAIVDGLLFPLLALAFTYGAQLAMGRLHPVPLLKIAVPVLMSLAGIRFLARVFTLAFPSSGFARAVERLFSWLAWLAAVLWIVGVLPAVMAELDAIQLPFGKTKVSLLAMGQGLLASGAVLVAALWISAVLERRVLSDAVEDLSLRKAAASALRAALLLVGLLLALSAVGVDLTALSVLGGALGLGLGFGLQKLAANYVSGFVILFERSLRIGDTVKVDSFEGVVTDIKTRYTLIRSPAGRESIVPNEKLISERVENLSLGKATMLLSTEVTVANDSDPDTVERVLLEAAAAVERVLKEPAPAVRLLRFAPDGLEFAVWFSIAGPNDRYAAVKSDVNMRILKGLRDAGISLPVQQRVIRIDGEVTSSTRAATG